MSNDKMREEFEAWHKGQVRMLICAGEPVAAKHCENLKAVYQNAWEASRESLVIELPEERIARGYGEKVADALGFNDGVNYCREAIEAVGLKVKS